MKDRKQIALPDNAGQLFLFLNASRVLRLELTTSLPGCKEGVVERLDERPSNRVHAVVRYDDGAIAGLLLSHMGKGHWITSTGSRKLVCYEAEGESPMATPVEPAAAEKKLKDKVFSEAGVMPSDHPGINDMLKKGFKEVFGGEMPAPAKRTLPSSKALFITASERYMGLGFNDEIQP